MTNYSRGAQFERRIKKQLEAQGFFVVRSAGSKGPADLIALGSTEILLIQCKVGSSKATAEDKQTLKEIGQRVGAKSYIVEKDAKGVWWTCLS